MEIDRNWLGVARRNHKMKSIWLTRGQCDLGGKVHLGLKLIIRIIDDWSVSLQCSQVLCWVKQCEQGLESTWVKEG